jgi:hypothetical protein
LPTSSSATATERSSSRRTGGTWSPHRAAWCSAISAPTGTSISSPTGLGAWRVPRRRWWRSPATCRARPSTDIFADIATGLNGGGFPETTALGDFDGDGFLDIAASDPGLTIARGHGDGTFDAPVLVLNTASLVVAADFNDDGKSDLALSGYDPGTGFVNKVVILLAR